MYVILEETDTETHFGGFLSFDIDKNGRLVNQSETVSTNGSVPCHLEVTENGSYVVNYLSGSIVKLGEKTVTHTGKGIHSVRQEAPHTHFVSASANKKYILCTDLGLDTVFVYDSELNLVSSERVPAGSGCRHLCFSKDGKYVYCVNELSNDVSVMEWNDGKPLLKGTYSAIPDYRGESTAAAIRIKDDKLYICNRGADTVSRFKICGDRLELLDNTSCGGSGPRDFYIIDNYIICTNETSNTVNVLKEENEKLFLTDEMLEIERPFCALDFEL